MAVGLRSTFARSGRRLFRRLEVVRRTGRWRPDHIDLAASGHRIHIDPNDERGWEIVRGLGRGHQPNLIDLWLRSVEALRPTVVVDVGANYGELVLSARYPVGTAVHAVEANPSVASLLERSVEFHPDGARIDVHRVLASDVDEASGTLYLDPASSGSASMAAPAGWRQQLTAPVRRLDTLVAPASSADRVLLKVDAEGWEMHVVDGAVRLLDAATSALLIIEFAPVHLRRAGTDPETLFRTLKALGRCWSVDWSGTFTPVDDPPQGGPVDLVVVSDPEVARLLGLRSTVDP